MASSINGVSRFSVLVGSDRMGAGHELHRGKSMSFRRRGPHLAALLSVAVLSLAFAVPAAAQSLDMESARNQTVVRSLSLTDLKGLIADLGWTGELAENGDGQIEGMVFTPGGLQFLLTAHDCEGAGADRRCTAYDLFHLVQDPPAGALQRLTENGDTRMSRGMTSDSLAIFRIEHIRMGVTRAHILATLHSWAEALTEDLREIARH